MILSQHQLDAALDRTHTLPVIVSTEGPLPAGNPAYRALRALPQTGFSFTPRDLLHAIGCKTAALPTSPRDECLKVAWLYTHILDLEGPHLAFQGNFGSDLQIARSQEIGIGILCLIAERFFGIPWDQLGPLPDQGKRFDYRGTKGRMRCIFEAKGTSNLAYQNSQIKHGLTKKAAHHARGDQFDVELIVSSCIEHNGRQPRIMLADPDKSSFNLLYERGDDQYYRIKHRCRILQYVGLPRSAYRLNRFARAYLDKRMSAYQKYFRENDEFSNLETIALGGDEFLGRWFDNWLPASSKRYKRLYDITKEYQLPTFARRRSVFAGSKA